jgi:hypothetical protein
MKIEITIDIDDSWFEDSDWIRDVLNDSHVIIYSDKISDVVFDKKEFIWKISQNY